MMPATVPKVSLYIAETFSYAFEEAIVGPLFQAAMFCVQAILARAYIVAQYRCMHGFVKRLLDSD